MRLDARAHQFFNHEPPAGTALDRKRDVITAAEPGQPTAQAWPRRRSDLTGAHFAGVCVQVIERDLCSVHVKTAYNCHTDPLELLFLCKSILLVPRGSLHMPSFRSKGGY